MQGVGTKLRDLRNHWKLTLREVEERSLLLAEEWGNPSYRISASWLDRVERLAPSLSATKLVVLAAIYGMTGEEMLGLYSPAALNPTRLEQVPGPNATVLLERGPFEEHAKFWLPEKLVTDDPPEETELLPQEKGVLSRHFRRGIIGRRDRTLDPMILPGSIVLIDVMKRAIASRREWTHEFNRPIYFLLTRTGYVTGFCELDKDSHWLTVVPHALSYEVNRRWRFRKEIEVIGTVAGVFTRRVA